MEEWGEISPASENVQGLLNRDKYCGNWRSRVLEGANPTQVTPGESRPMLTLGLGELSDESLQKVETPEVAQIQDRFSLVAQGTEGVTDVIKAEKISKADEMEDALIMGGGRYEAHWSTEEDRLSAGDASSGGGSGAMLLVVGAVVLWTLYS
jgi:hypothetical protein